MDATLCRVDELAQCQVPATASLVSNTILRSGACSARHVHRICDRSIYTPLSSRSRHPSRFCCWAATGAIAEEARGLARVVAMRAPRGIPKTFEHTSGGATPRRTQLHTYTARRSWRLRCSLAARTTWLLCAALPSEPRPTLSRSAISAGQPSTGDAEATPTRISPPSRGTGP